MSEATAGASNEREPSERDSIIDVDPETSAIIAIERVLRELDEEQGTAARTRKPSTRVLAYIAERYKIIGAPGRKPRDQGG